MNDAQIIMDLAGILIPVAVLTVIAIINIINMDRKDRNQQ